MKKQILLAAFALLFSVSGFALDGKSIYDYSVKDIHGNDVSLASYKGKVLLIVNVASKCGLTPQYEGLEALYRKYKDQGFEILAFPCNQFLGQEPGDNEAIEKFCTLKYDVTFTLFDKIDVNGKDAHPIFEFLKAEAPTEEYNGLKAKATHTMLKTISTSVEKESDILWNFTKFLIGRDGHVVKRFAPTADPTDFEKDIEALLN